MEKRVKGLTIEIDADTTKFDKKINEMVHSLRNVEGSVNVKETKAILREAIPKLAEKMVRAVDGQSALAFAEALIKVIDREGRFHQ